MDLRRTLDEVREAFESRGLDYALIGGFALAAWGCPRNTIDLDLLVRADRLSDVDDALASIGYTPWFRSENVTHLDRAGNPAHRIDLLHAFRPASLEALRRARRVPLGDSTADIPVVEPEDLIGFKVQALANDPDRRAQDLADILALAAHLGTGLDLGRVRDYCDLFSESEIFEAVRKRAEEA